MKSSIILAALLALNSIPAHAAKDESRFACGAGREKGAEHAEMGLVYALDGNHFYLSGVEQDSSKVSVSVRGENWVVNVEQKDGTQLAYEIHDKKGDMQEYLESDSGAEKKIGAAKPCKVELQDE